MDTTTATLVEQAHAALEAARRVDHIAMQSPPIVFRHAAGILRGWDGKRLALIDYIVAVRAAIAEDHDEAVQIVTDWEADVAGWDADFYAEIEAAAERARALTPAGITGETIDAIGEDRARELGLISDAFRTDEYSQGQHRIVAGLGGSVCTPCNEGRGGCRAGSCVCRCRAYPPSDMATYRAARDRARDYADRQEAAGLDEMAALTRELHHL